MFRRVSSLAVLLFGVGGFAILSGVLPSQSLPSLSPFAAQLPFPTEEEARPQPRSGMGMGPMRELNLSGEQFQKIRAVHLQYRDRLQEQRKTVRQLRGDLTKLMTTDATPEQARQKYREFQAAKQTLAEQQFDRLLQIREILTVEQRQKFANQMRQRNPQSRP